MRRGMTMLAIVGVIILVLFLFMKLTDSSVARQVASSGGMKTAGLNLLPWLK